MKYLKRCKAWNVHIYIVPCLFIFTSCIRHTPPPILAGGQITYAQNIQALIQQHCLACHHGRGPGPYDFSIYTNVVRQSALIKQVVQSGYMPPWKPDPAYSHFLAENYLAPDEKSTLLAWINNNMPLGDSSAAVSSANMSTYSIPPSGPNTINLEMAAEYEHPGDGRDHYMNFIIPLIVSRDLLVQNAEIIPGNQKIVHHAWLVTDTTGSAFALDAASGGRGFEGGLGVFPLDNFIQGYLPGSSAHPYMADMAKLIKKNAALVLQIHYCPYYKKAKDRCKVRLLLSQAKNPRMVHTGLLLEDKIIGKQFVLEPETIDSFTSQLILQENMQLISVAPHMHYHGHSAEAYALTRRGRVPLIRINYWDFNWQGMYYLKAPVTLFSGDTIVFKTIYDNTSRNVNNPQVPPVEIHYGESSKDEMCQFIFEYMD